MYPAAPSVDVLGSFAGPAGITQGSVLSESVHDRAVAEYEQIKDVVDRIEKDVNKWGIHDVLQWLEDHGLQQLTGCVFVVVLNL